MKMIISELDQLNFFKLFAARFFFQNLKNVSDELRANPLNNDF